MELITEESVVGKVRHRMTDMHLSQAAMAARLGRNQQWLGRRLVGAVPFSVDELATIADALGVPITDLLPDSEGQAADKSEQPSVSPAPHPGATPEAESGWTDSPPSIPQRAS